jgi:hypothetical protein
MVMAGTEISMVWHIGIKFMDPRLVKMILPGAVGLTSRVLDKDTGAATAHGNMKLDPARAQTLAAVRRGEAKVRADKEKALKKLR